MSFITATQSNWFLIGPIAKVLGYLMNWIFMGISAIGLPNIGLAIILFTLVIKALMIPLSIKQQKFSKLQAVMQPELTRIQNKYKGKTDNASLMAQQEETKEVYAKYGTSATGGCLQSLIQMPVLFALYQVIYKMPGYITELKGYYLPIANALKNISGYDSNEELMKMVVANGVKKVDLIKLAEPDHLNYIIDMMYNFTREEWQTFLNIFNNADMTAAYNNAAASIDKANYFLGIDLTMTPMQQLWPAIFIPLLAGGLQWLSTKLMEMGNKTGVKKNKDQQQDMMKSMNIMFPIMSVVFCFMFSAGLGVYWVASSGIQVIIQLIVNKYMDKVDLNEMVKKNVEKMNEKRVKKGLPEKKVANITSEVHNLEEEAQKEKRIEESLAEKAKASTEYYASRSTARKGSLAEKAGMVLQYEERQKELKSGKSKE